jgi:hypothetical protein
MSGVRNDFDDAEGVVRVAEVTGAVSWQGWVGRCPSG